MKRVVYSGLNTKCLILSASVIEAHPYNEGIAKQTISWFIETALGGTSSPVYQELSKNINVIPVESREAYFEENAYYLNTYLVSYKLPERMSREVINLLQNRSLRDRKFPGENTAVVYPIIGMFKAIGGDGVYTSKLINHINIQHADEWHNWFTYQAQNQNKHSHAVLGINTDAMGYAKSANMNYYYGSLPQYQIEVAIYDNSAEAINEKEGFWIKTSHLSTPAQDYGVAPGINKIKFNAYLDNGTLVVSDNVNGIASIRDKISENRPLITNTDIILTNQYSLNHNNNGHILAVTMSSGINHNVPRTKTVTFLLMNKARIIDVTPNTRPTSLDGTVTYLKNKKNKINFRTSMCRQFENMYGIGDGLTFVLPFEVGKETHLEALDILYRYLSVNNNVVSEECKEKYFYSILMPSNAEAKDDILMDWFRKCSATAKSDEEKLREAYQNLKDGLLKEYQDIEKYLAANNFNDKKPVPSIRVEEEFSRSPLNKLAFGFDTEVIEAINYTRLDRAVQNKFIAIRYMIPWIDRRGQKGFVKGSIPLINFYDKTTNTVKLNSNKIIAEHIGRMGR